MEKALKTALFAISTPAFTGGALARGRHGAAMVAIKPISTTTKKTMTKDTKKVRGG